MKRATLYGLLSRLTAALGLWGASTLGGRSMAIALVCLLVSAAGWTRRQPLTTGQRTGWRWANIGVSMLCLGGVMLEPVREDALTALLCWLVAHGAWAHQGSRGGRVNLLLSLLILSFASVASHSLIVLGLIAVVAMIAPLLLSLSLLIDESGGNDGPSSDSWVGWRVLLLLPCQGIIALSVLFFMPIDPSADLPSELGSGRAGGLGTLALHEMGDISDDSSIVLRARITAASGEQLQGPFYFPMERLRDYDSATRAWSHPELELQAGPIAPPHGLTGLIEQEVSIESLAGGQLLAMVEPVAIDVSGGSRLDSLGGWWRNEGQGPVSYTAWSRIDGPQVRESGEVVVPVGLDPQVRTLTLQWLRELPSGASDRAKAEHLAQSLRQSFRYESDPSEILQTQTVVGFLKSSRRGHCTYFATSLALMLRVAGIDSRVVRGFVGSDRSPFDGLVRARRSDAHAWVEARLDGRWETLDATPVATSMASMSVLEAAGEWVRTQWDELLWVFRSTELGQIFFTAIAWLRVHAAVLLVILLSLLSMITGLREGRAWWRRHQKELSRGQVALRYDRARELVRRRGWRIPPQLPPRQAARWLVEQAGALAEPLETLAWLHYRVRYGGEPDQVLVDDAETALGELKVLPRRRRA
jgi:hypothetical protein